MAKLFLDCSSGAAGDMLLAALLDVQSQLSGVNSLEEGLADWSKSISVLLATEQEGRYELQRVQRAGMAALKIDFYAGEVHSDHHHHHEHRHLSQIRTLLEQQLGSGSFTQAAFDLSIRSFEILAEAEAKVHGSSPEEVHFHEVGAFDSIMDIAGFASAFCKLDISEVESNPVTLGSGYVSAAHGTMAVPPPAVVEILRAYSIPSSQLSLPGECLTPTGAAILAAVVTKWTDAPSFVRIEAQGTGAGTREIESKANTVRAIYGS